jgi:hypothetical protein
MLFPTLVIRNTLVIASEGSWFLLAPAVQLLQAETGIPRFRSG